MQAKPTPTIATPATRPTPGAVMSTRIQVDPPARTATTPNACTQPPRPNADDQETSNEHGAAAMRSLIGAHVDNVLHPMEEEEPMIPITSQVMRDTPQLEFNLNNRKQRALMLKTLPTDVQLKLNQPFGKDDLSHSFTNEANFRTILLPLLFSDFLEDDDWNTLCQCNLAARNLQSLLDDYGTVDFRPLRTNFFRDGWQDATDFDYDRSAMLNACTLFYRGDIASVVRYVGGSFVGAHRDVDKILADIRPIVPEQVYKDVERIYRQGAPAHCCAESTDENYRDFLHYGNHESMIEDPALTKKTLLKDEKRGHIMMLDKRIRWHALRPHSCPVGIVDQNHPIKKPRFIYDASFLPHLWSHTINTWTTKETEPELEFPSALNEYLVWLWNMRITYPDEEIYPIDDDITAAFRTVCWHPNMVSMHGMVVLNLLFFMCRLSFGDTTCPPHWEPIAVARKHLARYFYDQPDTIERVKQFIPNLDIITPSAADIKSIMRIPRDSKNPGVIDPSTGKAKPPPYVHHVDDELYGALARHIKRAIAASILALYTICGFPTATQPDPFSYDKFESAMTHQRKVTGIMVDTRSMYVWHPDYKRKHIVDLLHEWVVESRTHFTVRDALELQGTMIDASRWYRWGRIHTFILQSTIRQVLRAGYASLVRIRHLTEERVERELAKANLQPATIKKLKYTGCNKIYARYLYHTKTAIALTPRLRQELTILHDYMSDFTNPWRINIGHIIPRDHVAVNVGDSSHYGVGFFSDELRAFCMMPTSQRIRERTRLSSRNAAYVHQNVLEYITAVLDFACSITLLEHASCEALRQELFPDGIPPMPCILSMKDNTSAESWINKAASSSLQAQQIIRVMAEIGKSTNVHQDSAHIPSDENDGADTLSRPDEPRYSLDHEALVAHLDHVLTKYPRFNTYKVFLPSNNLLSAITWALRPTDQLNVNQLTPPPVVQPYGTFITPAEFRVSIQILY